MNRNGRREIPHSNVSYAGFPVSGTNGVGLWCPICGLPLRSVIHAKGEVLGVHYLVRTLPHYPERWTCVIQGKE